MRKLKIESSPFQEKVVIVIVILLGLASILAALI